MSSKNPHAGSDFDDFLKEEGIFEEIQEKASSRAVLEERQDKESCGSVKDGSKPMDNPANPGD